MFIVLTNNKATMSHGCKPRISNSIKVWQLGIGNRELSAMLCSRDHPSLPPPSAQFPIPRVIMKDKMFFFKTIRNFQKVAQVFPKFAQELPPPSPSLLTKNVPFLFLFCLLSVTTSECMYNANCVINLAATQ